MPQANGSRRQVAFITEATFGTTPPTPQTQLIEFNKFAGSLDVPLLKDPSVRADRQVAYVRRGNESVIAELEVSLCASNYDSFVEAALQGTWATNVVTIPATPTQRSFAVEEGFVDLGQYRTFNGCVIDTYSLEVKTDSLVTAKFGFVGASESTFSGTSIDTTPTAITAKPKFYHVGGTFKEGGSAVAFVTAISFELKNNLTPSNVLGISGVRSISSGKADVTGKMTVLFEDVAVYNKFKGNTTSSIEFTLTDGTNSHTYLFPKVSYTKGTISDDAEGPLVVEVEFTAYYDVTQATTLKVTRV